MEIGFVADTFYFTLFVFSLCAENKEGSNSFREEWSNGDREDDQQASDKSPAKVPTTKVTWPVSRSMYISIDLLE